MGRPKGARGLVFPHCQQKTVEDRQFSSGVGRCLILGGPNFFGDIYMYAHAGFLCV